MAYNLDFYGDGHIFIEEINEPGMDFIERFEQWVPKWYTDGEWRSGPKKGETKYSCCFGHQEGGDNPPFKYDPNQTFTMEEGRLIFRNDLKSKSRFVRTRATVKLNSFMFSALVSLVYNYGEGNVDEVNSVFPLLNQELYLAAGVGFLKCNKITLKDGTVVEKNGLTTRRACEIALFSTRVMKGTNYV